MNSLFTRFATLRKTNENGSSLGEIMLAIAITSIIIIMTTNIQITTMNAQVALVTKMDVSTNARLMSSKLAYLSHPKPIPLNIRSQGCGGTPIVMARFPVIASDTTCITITGTSWHYFVTGVAYNTNKEVRFTFESQPIDLAPVIVLMPRIETSTSSKGVITETTTWQDGTVSKTVVQTTGKYTTTQTSPNGTIKTLSGTKFVFGAAKLI